MWMALHHYHIRPSILRNAREVVLVDGSLSGVVIRLVGFHLLFSSMGSTGTVVAGNGTNAFSIYTSIHHFNETTIIIMRGTALFT